MGRKFALWISQGKILDRTRERLGAADRGVVQLRQKFLSQANLVADGGTPKSVAIRGVTLQLPEMAEATNSKGEEPAAAIDGQPPEALDALKHVLESWRPYECGPT
jgi:hypothetical protein